MDDKVAILIAVAIATCFFMYIVHAVRGVRETREKEQTRREIAAYVAEGSITPDDAVKLLKSGDGDNAESMIADGVAWGTISPAKAERLIRAMRDEGGSSAPRAVS